MAFDFCLKLSDFRFFFIFWCEVFGVLKDPISLVSPRTPLLCSGGSGGLRGVAGATSRAATKGRAGGRDGGVGLSGFGELKKGGLGFGGVKEVLF